MPTPVDRLYEEFKDLVEYLAQQPSLQSTADDSFRKSLLLAATSFFEMRLCEAVETFVRESSQASSLLVSLVRLKAINRQYHTWFDWERSNANQFYKLFGKEFHEFMRAKHLAVEGLDASVSSFMELGRSRNLLVHENYAVFTLEKTAAEIYKTYESAMGFVEGLPGYLRECNQRTVTDNDG